MYRYKKQVSFVISAICTKEKVDGYPTFKLYVNGAYLTEYNGGREESDLIKYLENAPSVKDEL